MENQASTKNIIINYGLILGVIGLLPSLIKYAMGGNYLENDSISGILSVIVSIIFIVLAYKKFKTNNNGFMTWGQGVKIGMGIIFISMIITILYLLLFTNFIEPDFKAQVIEASEQKWIDAGYSDDQIEMSKEMTNKYFNLSMFGGIAIMSLFFGFVVSAITSAIMKKNEEEQY
ncbi:uncharacterized protein DUF4199 [Lutibacter sp. Hel_I_33_5]|uniref:DUF4199 domain-containing protein n=1 Tax=Lutibacter sp. Hel_I_33_5 TaxID=1566289 RepID=UPI0011A5297F|nr:DUF4199 domain-containing protein [Lutibacter sp. Hel_I_33_5]TVZ55371.1 uncharacterized protein DUF4199 [Lutibacter sp. Hel_I_33_5]